MAAVWKHFKDGGWGMYVILFWSILTVGVIVERALYLYGSSINKEVFLATMQKCILAGDVDREAPPAAARPAPHLPEARNGAGERDAGGRVELTLDCDHGQVGRPVDGND